ncbi:MAG: GAF domain-containing protein [Chloroflexi bacterium]|nr:GAF domain-containing protein [Chloroflexota bacterium]
MLRTFLQPAILLMNRLAGAIKPVILATVFVLALSVPTYQMISGLNADIAFSEKELRGTEYLPSTLSLLQHVQQHRGIAAAFLSGDASFEDALTSQQASIEEDIQAVDALQKKYGVEFGSVERWDEFKAEWVSLRDEVKTLSADDSFNRHVALIDKILDFQILIADASNLTLDPDVDTYYLMITSTSDYPAASEYMGQVRAFGAAALADGTIEEQRSALTILLQRSRDAIDRADEKVERSMDANPSVRTQVEQAFQPAKAQQQTFLNMLETQVLDAPTVTITPAEYLDKATQAIDAQFNLVNVLTRDLERLLDARIQRISTQRATIVSLVSVFALLAAWLFAGFYLSSTTQLQDLVTNLEVRVAERTGALTTVAEIGTATSTILELDKLLQEVVALSKQRFNLYHSHIYLLDEAGQNLVLAAGAGEAGRIMVSEGRSIPLSREQSLVARAARERRGVTVNDVTQAPDFLPNPLLPDTRSELAVPMIVGNQVLGVFDVQSNVAGRFTGSDIDIQTTLAAQVASAVQNTRLYAQAEAARQDAKSLVDYAAEGIAILDLETELWAEPNENFANVFGMPRKEMAETGPKIMSPPAQPDGRNSVEKTIEMINIAMEKGSHRFEWVHLKKDGTMFDCEIGLVRMPGDHPRLRQSILDITERKRLEKLTAQRAKHQESLNLITQKIQSATTIESAMQVAARELGHALGRKPTMVELDTTMDGQGQSQKENAQ